MVLDFWTVEPRALAFPMRWELEDNNIKGTLVYHMCIKTHGISIYYQIFIFDILILLFLNVFIY